MLNLLQKRLINYESKIQDIQFGNRNRGKADSSCINQLMIDTEFCILVSSCKLK